MADDVKANSEAENADAQEGDQAEKKTRKPKEIGGPPGPEPTRYGDWESKGRCTDF